LLSVEGEVIPRGTYERRTLEVEVKQRTPFAVDFFAGYRFTEGTLPVYKGDLETLTGGEFRAGARASILRGLAIDPERASQRIAGLEAEIASCSRRWVEIELGVGAAAAYWKWVATGQKLAVATLLLSVAQQREAALNERAAQGSLPTIAVVDNYQLVLARKAKQIDARQAFGQAAVELSLYLRDQDGRTRVAAADVLPTRIAPVPAGVLSKKLPADFPNHRPDICVLQRKRAQEIVKLDLQKNTRLPTLDLEGFLSQDVGQGDPRLAPAEAGIGLRFEMPLFLRKARGETERAAAAVGLRTAELRGAEDGVGAEVASARVRLRAAIETAELAVKRTAAADRLAEGERERFRQGMSDLVTVNLREITAAEAAELQIEALADSQIALAAYRAATGEALVGRLGAR